MTPISIASNEMNITIFSDLCNCGFFSIDLMTLISKSENEYLETINKWFIIANFKTSFQT